MESRFRKFLGHRREKVNSTPCDLDTRSFSYQAAEPTTPPPIYIYQPLGKSCRQTRKLEEQGLSLKALSYDAVPAGKAPVFGSKPQKGNGPIRLQTSRRLSSGELLPTSQNTERTLEDIREGDYIVGRKDSSPSNSSRSATPHSGTSTPVPAYTPRDESATSRPVSSRTVPGTTKTAWSSPPSPKITRHSFGHSIAGTDGLGLDLSSPATSTLKYDQYDTKTGGKTSFVGKHILLHPIEEQNATITALWKAEYGRLVTLYGQTNADYKITVLNRQNEAAPTHGSLRNSAKMSRADLEPLPLPTYDRRILESKRSSAISRVTSIYRDDSSDASSTKRESTSSSWAASSSYTTQTSFGDFDLPTTRDDIRKIVAEMRSTYLRALEAQSPPRVKPKISKKKKRVKTTSQLTTASGEQTIDRQTWHGAEIATETSLTESKKPRAASHPVQGLNRFSKTEHSLTKPSLESQTTTRPELHRADSMTLGGLMRPAKETQKSRQEPEPQNRVKESQSAHTARSQTPAIDDWLAIDEHFLAMDTQAPKLDDVHDLVCNEVTSPTQATSVENQNSTPHSDHRISRSSVSVPQRPPRPTGAQMPFSIFNFI